MPLSRLDRLKADFAASLPPPVPPPAPPTFWDAVQTGYFGRAKENGHTAVSTRYVHLAYRGQTPLCSYRPHASMRFVACSMGVYLPYVTCPQCQQAYKADHP